MLSGMFLDSLEFLSEIFKSRIRCVSFSAPPNHHVRATAPAIPASLKSATHVFVRDDSSTPPLRGQYLVLQYDEKNFYLQLGAREVPQVPPIRGRSWRAPPDCSPPSAAPNQVRFSFLLSPPRPPSSSLFSPSGTQVLRRNPPRAARQPTTASSPRQPRR